MGQRREMDLDAVFVALAHPTRRAMIKMLASGDASVSTLAEPFGISLTVAGKHLRALSAAGLVEHHKQGRVRVCRLVATPLQGVDAWIDDYRLFWEGQFDSLAAHVGGPAQD